nr:hypothetical protein [Piscirickettsia salmonis]
MLTLFPSHFQQVDMESNGNMYKSMENLSMGKPRPSFGDSRAPMVNMPIIKCFFKALK